MEDRLKVRFVIGYGHFLKGSVHDLGGAGEGYVRRGVAVEVPGTPRPQIETAAIEPAVETADATPKRRKRQR